MKKYDGFFTVTTYTKSWAGHIQEKLEGVYPLKIGKAPPGEIRLDPVNELEYHPQGLEDLGFPFTVFASAVDELRTNSVAYEGPSYLLTLKVWERMKRVSEQGEELSLPSFPSCALETVHVKILEAEARYRLHDLNPGSKNSDYARAIEICRHGILHHSFRERFIPLLWNEALLDEIFACFKQYHG